jgi:hypothetical protein
LVGNPEWKRVLGRRRLRWEGNNAVKLEKLGRKELTGQTYVNSVMNYQVQ